MCKDKIDFPPPTRLVDKSLNVGRRCEHSYSVHDSLTLAMVSPDCSGPRETTALKTVVSFNGEQSGSQQPCARAISACDRGELATECITLSHH